MSLTVKSLDPIVPSKGTSLPYVYKVYKNGSSYYALDESGRIYQDSELDELLTDEVVNGLAGTYPQAISLSGDLTLNDQVILDEAKAYAPRIDAFNAKISLGADIDAMFTHATLADGARISNFTINGGLWHGNKATRTKGALIKGAFNSFEMYHAKVYAFIDPPLSVIRYGATKVDALRLGYNWIGGTATGTSNKNGGLLLQCTGNNGINDVKSAHNYWINNGKFHIKQTHNCHNNHFFDEHFAGWAEDANATYYNTGIICEGDVRKFLLEHSHFEQTQKEAILFTTVAGNFADCNQIHNNNFYDTCRVTHNTYSIIKFDCTAGQARHCSIQGNTMHSDQANKAKYAIELIGGTNYFVMRHNPIQTNAWQTGWIANVGAQNSVDAANALN